MRGRQNELEYWFEPELEVKSFSAEATLTRFIVPVAQTAQLPALGQMSSWTGRAAS